MTPKQSRFVEEYLIDLNATQAAIRAGYAPKNADVQGPDLLGKLGNEINAALAARSVRTGINADRVVRELARVAFADPRAVFSWGPGGVRLNSSGWLSGDDAAIIAEVSETRVKLCDKLKALELLGRHLGMFSDKLQVNMTISPKSILEELRERREGG